MLIMSLGVIEIAELIPGSFLYGARRLPHLRTIRSRTDEEGPRHKLKPQWVPHAKRDQDVNLSPTR